MYLVRSKSVTEYMFCAYRRLFKLLTDKNYSLVSTMYEGDAYAVQGITKTDRLGILLSGS